MPVQLGALGPGLVTVTRDPSLVGLDTGAMRAAAAAYASAGQKLSGIAGQISSKASSVVGTPAWTGAGGIGFSLAADQASNAARTAVNALGPVSTALTALAGQLDAAVAQATQAETLAGQVNTATAQLNSSYEQRVSGVLAAQPGGPVLGTGILTGATQPTGAEAATAAQLTAQATQAQQMMTVANNQAHLAWQTAASAFDAATAQAPSVQAAVANLKATAAAKYKSAHQGNLLMGGLSILGMAALPIGSAAADFFSGGTAAVGTSEEAAAEGAMGTEAAASFGSMDAAALASAEETAATTTAVDGTTLDSQVVNEAAAYDPSDPGPGQFGPATGLGGSERAWAYQEQVTGNPRTVGYYVNNPVTAKPVEFDDYQNGELIDAKGPGYNNLLSGDPNKFPTINVEKGIVDSATRQVQAAQGQPIVWHVAEQGAADKISTLLENSGLGSNIRVVWNPNP
jgi:uncharacterized protein YukE